MQQNIREKLQAVSTLKYCINGGFCKFFNGYVPESVSILRSIKPSSFIHHNWIAHSRLKHTTIQ